MEAVDKIKEFLGFRKPIATRREEPKASSYYSTGTYRPIFTVSYDGEKNLGEVGPIKHYMPDYEALRLRSWQAYLESEIAQMVIGKYIKWVIGTGLKLQAEPEERVLASEGIKIDTEEFNDIVEARFNVFAKSKSVDYSGLRSLHKIGKRAYKDAIIGGDTLVIMRYVNDEIKIQLIDGAHVKSPMYGNDYHAQALANGNEIKNGIEQSASGEHVAFYVCKKNMEFERIAAKEVSTELTMAFMMYGLEYRLDNNRGLPLISAMLETLKKLERYKEATVGSAEELAKIAWQVVHNVNATGENPFNGQLAKIVNADATDDVPEDIRGNLLADKVAATTNKTAVNNPPGAEIKPITGSQKELYFEPFYNVNIGLLCAAINIPKDVATSQYNSNFSASRAALKDWEHTIVTDRSEAPAEFYQHVYNFFLEIEILKKKVQAPGYLMARIQGNKTVIQAYRNARWVGSPVPHIDPVKEVTAERLKLGTAGAALPLTTAEAATEALNSGDSDQNLLQFADELSRAKKLKVEAPQPQQTNNKKEKDDDD
jgi:capsid protein